MRQKKGELGLQEGMQDEEARAKTGEFEGL